MNTTSQNNLSRLIPVMLCFFAMGFVDLHLPFLGILLVSYILGADRNSDEPYRP